MERVAGIWHMGKLELGGTWKEIDGRRSSKQGGRELGGSLAGK
jgi:hypothetical protein